MKDNETKEKFIELRAKGYSFDKISSELKVCKQTLIYWSRDFEEEIGNLKAIELEALQEQYFMTKKQRIEKLGETLNVLELAIKNKQPI